MKEYIINNIDILKELVKIDEKIMKEKVDIDSLLKEEEAKYTFHNAFILYDGNPKTTVSILNQEIKNTILYANDNFLGVNHFLVNYKDNVYLSKEKNDFKYQKISDLFDKVVVVNAKEMYQELKPFYPNLTFITL